MSEEENVKEVLEAQKRLRAPTAKVFQYLQEQINTHSKDSILLAQTLGEKFSEVAESQDVHSVTGLTDLLQALDWDRRKAENYIRVAKVFKKDITKLADKVSKTGTTLGISHLIEISKLDRGPDRTRVLGEWHKTGLRVEALRTLVVEIQDAAAAAAADDNGEEPPTSRLEMKAVRGLASHVGKLEDKLGEVETVDFSMLMTDTSTKVVEQLEVMYSNVKRGIEQLQAFLVRIEEAKEEAMQRLDAIEPLPEPDGGLDFDEAFAATSAEAEPTKKRAKKKVAPAKGEAPAKKKVATKKKAATKQAATKKVATKKKASTKKTAKYDEGFADADADVGTAATEDTGGDETLTATRKGPATRRRRGK